MTVSELVNGFLAHQSALVGAGQLQKSTRSWYAHNLKHLTKAVGDVPASELRVSHLAAMNFTYPLVRSMKYLFRWAVDEEVIVKNPFRKLPLPKCGQRNRTIKRDEMARLYRASSRKFRLFLFMMRYTLARPGELRCLTWKSVDIEGRVIRLRSFKAKNRRKDNMQERVIAVASPAMRVLIAWHGRRNPKPTDPVFPERFGRVRQSNALRCLMKSARDKAGLTEDLNGERIVIYTMRHTGATNAIRNGLPPMLLARIMGHTKLETTWRYVHLEEGDMVVGIDTATKRPKK